MTGASHGIGAAIALELAVRGYRVACLSRSGRIPHGMLHDGTDMAASLHGICCDITDSRSIEAAMSSMAALPAKLSGLVNCAGIVSGGESCDFPLADFEAIMRTNVSGTFSVCQAVYPALVARGGGLIVNLGSFWDRMGIKKYAAYCASKAAVAALTRCLGVEWARQGIRIVNVAPGFLDVPMQTDDQGRAEEQLSAYLESRIPAGRKGRTEEIARVVAGLFTENVEFLNATTIYVDGGQGPAM